MVTPEAQGFIELYTFYKNNILALSGGVLEQPKKYIDAMKVIDRQVNSD